MLAAAACSRPSPAFGSFSRASASPKRRVRGFLVRIDTVILACKD